MFAFALAHLDQSFSAARNARSMAGQAALESNAFFRRALTPGACKIALIVISPGAFNSFATRASRRDKSGQDRHRARASCALEPCDN